MSAPAQTGGAENPLVCGVTAEHPAVAGETLARMRELLVYWDARREGRAAIPRARLDPIDIPKCLPNMFLVDRVDGTPFDILFRLVGTRIADFEGDITDRRLSSLIPIAPRTERLWEHYARALSGEVCLRRETLHWQEREFVPYWVLLLPMTRSGEEIDSAVGMALYGV